MAIHFVCGYMYTRSMACAVHVSKPNDYDLSVEGFTWKNYPVWPSCLILSQRVGI